MTSHVPPEDADDVLRDFRSSQCARHLLAAIDHHTGVVLGQTRIREWWCDTGRRTGIGALCPGMMMLSTDMIIQVGGTPIW